MVELRRGAPAELWQALVHEAGERAGCALDESRESYLVFVLLRHQGDGQLLARTQALEWLHAQSLGGRMQEDALRDVGDRCLLIAGLHPALAQRRHVDVRYFIDIGRSAYRGVAEVGRSAYTTLFAQLAESYGELVHTLRALRPETPAISDARLGRLVAAPGYH
ncbi:hypothetical protein DWG18_10795 [Lysobacter sp. TY2-98]|uniref:hypothetical protein n=1 Tax=Lysobacter sp. TY2-98 TaxID=2290922 RepID=UPI000E20205C|nr:hypothetical protein [Lysobacter sp. TY2-98]AXK72713.1 hypothetical protein DWG18_10795 [Lysobacter sp. TY2-98]